MRAKKSGTKSFPRRSWLLALGAGTVTAAVIVAHPGLGLPSTTSSSITNSPK
ncbi:MAG: peptidase S41, partial [Planctomycetes bacterium]|nr:peptidase S41 [Planctomycetota bacterium]